MSIVVAPRRLVQLAGMGHLNNPFLLFRNSDFIPSLASTPFAVGGNAINAFSGVTYNKWRPLPTAGNLVSSLTMDYGSARSFDCFAIVGLNYGKVGARVQLLKSNDNVSYADSGAGIHSPADNKPICFRLDPSESAARYWRIQLTNLVAGIEVNAAVILLGNELIIPQRIYQGVEPILTPTEVQLQSNVSIGGELLGSSVIYRGSTLSADFTHIPSEFIRSPEWIDFQRKFGEGQGFLFAWRPDKYPDDVHYCARESGVIRPRNDGPRDRMSFKLAMRVYANG